MMGENCTTLALNLTGNVTLECPCYNEQDDYQISSLAFWIEGISQFIVAIFGVIGNLISAFILSRDEMRNAFNLLLISLLGFDSWFLLGCILENVRRNFDLASNLHILLFPYFLYPTAMVAMTGSIFMTVAISLERYFAVHHPIDYAQSANSPSALRNRLLKYLIPVILISFLFNGPKFFEARVGYSNSTVLATSTNETLTNLTLSDGTMNTVLEQESIEWTPYITVTSMRKNPDYSIYYNCWARLFFLGVIPAAMLIYLNYKIYKDIKERQENRRRQQTNSAAASTSLARRKMEDNLGKEHSPNFFSIILKYRRFEKIVWIQSHHLHLS
jgi:hypothetical protein